MKIGCCVPRDRLVAAREAGYDFAELTVTDNLRPTEDEAAWQPIRREIEAGGLPTEAANVFFPGDWPLVGPAVDVAATRAYIDTAVRRAALLGVGVMVFGSGRARNVPEGYPRQQALQQLDDVLRMMGEAGERHGVTIALEPLRQAETNLVHTVGEGAEIVRALGHPRVGVLADFYHMEEEAEPLDNLLTAGDWLRHVHLSDSSRLAPGTGHYDYPGFFARLRQAGYRGRVSIECRWTDWERESRQALAFLRRLASG